jgi:hypothetical protein
MNTVVLHVETELDPSAAPRVFGYLGGLGHIPLQAALRRDGGAAMVMEVHFESPTATAHLISAKVEQMPFVLNTRLAGGESAPEASGQAQPVSASGGALKVTDGMQHAPVQHLPCGPRIDAAALRFAAAQRGDAIHHRSRMHLHA